MAEALAFCPLASATVDWVMWLPMRDQGAFDDALAKTTVVPAIVSHDALGALLVVAIRRAEREETMNATPSLR